MISKCSDDISSDMPKRSCKSKQLQFYNERNKSFIEVAEIYKKNKSSHYISFIAVIIHSC